MSITYTSEQTANFLARHLDKQIGMTYNDISKLHATLYRCGVDAQNAVCDNRGREGLIEFFAENLYRMSEGERHRDLPTISDLVSKALERAPVETPTAVEQSAHVETPTPNQSLLDT
jgi:hypothetical protein